MFTLLFIQVKDEQRVLEFAKRKLEEDPRHKGIEVWENGVCLFGLGTRAGQARRGAAPRSGDGGV